MRHLNLKRLHEAALRDKNEDRFFDDFQEAVDTGEVSWRDFSLREAFIDLVPEGADLVNQWQRTPETGNRVSLHESGVQSTAFSKITGQLLVNAVMEKYNDTTFIGDQLCRTIPTRLPHGEKIPGLTRIGDDAAVVGEGQPYPYVGFGQDWIETPRTYKRGMICPLTRETIVQDLTGRMMEHAGEVGYWMGYNREKRILQTALGITSSYKHADKAIVATYGDNSGEHDFDNLAASNTLVDWTDIEVAELLFDGLTDPHTGEPIMVTPTTLVVPSALVHTARRIVNATSIEHVDNQANAATVRTQSANPLSNYTILSSQLVKTVTSSASTWFIGDFPRAFAYMEVSPAQVVQAPSNSHDEFHRDVMMQWKVSEWGAPAVIEPRYVVKCT